MDLLGHSASNKPSCGRCAFERDPGEQKTRAYGCDMRLSAGGLDGESESGLPGGLHRLEADEFIVQPCVSNHESRCYSVTASGANRRPAAGSLFCFGYAAFGYGFHLRWTLRKCRASALGVGPTR
jgi:hypothetical protein